MAGKCPKNYMRLKSLNLWETRERKFFSAGDS